ncbi:P-loop NTPase fold protein [Agreia sp. VKM Ac-1783]|uniref:KAP family P-loop NTPase fold protein n=1 Tax=Agreia sp. VKM Ac-1783 TaxID=1938889 RepID=UPI000A2AD835|nr:P-loop NTPase fold protein [Agreia sp. VKM Ac-1783]SMQ73442.1 KAP family P-loop domain-containing protein [Agreia sp. VKM Ac-1783]
MTYVPSAIEPWSDDPRSTFEIDGRSDFAKVISSRIDACVQGQGSTVFGVVGPWGSGKSNLLAKIKVHLDKEWTVVDFSPWSVSDSTMLTSEFVATLAAAFPKAKSLRKRLVEYSRYGTPALNLIPSVGSAASKLLDKVLSDMAARPPWHVEFGQLSQDIEDQGTRVLVVVDDVDRLDADELRGLFRVIRLVGRFTNVHYLLAYDQNTIEQLLSRAGSGGYSSDYTEKIVQYPFELPPVPKVVRRRWSRDIVEELVTPAVRDSSRYGYVDQLEELIAILANGLETPRAAHRLREQIVSLKTLVQGAEVDVLDFIAITWIRVTHHRLWDHIRLHPEEYFGWRGNASSEAQNQRDDLVASLLDRGELEPAQNALRFLFAPVDLPAAFAMREWRMHSSRFFERYFLIGVSQDDVSDRMIGRALRVLESGDSWTEEVDQLQDIVTGEDEDRAALALEAVNRMRNAQALPSTHVLNFVGNVRSSLAETSLVADARGAGLEGWLNREIFLALHGKVVQTSELVHRYGFEQLTYSAYLARRQMRGAVEEVRTVYREMASLWLQTIRNETLTAVISRSELIPMTSFLIWIADLADERGFLATKVSDAESVLQIAMAFIGFNEWVGAGVHYEVQFREQEFRFSLGNALTSSLLTGLPARIPIPEYETDELPERILSDAQRRDIALQRLAALEVLEDEGRATTSN